MSAHVLRSSRLLGVSSAASSSSSTSSASPLLARAFSASSASLLPPKKATAVKPVVKKKNSKGPTSKGRVKPLRSGGWGNFSFDKSQIPRLNPEPETLTDGLPAFSPETLTSENVGKKMVFAPEVFENVKTWGHPTGQQDFGFTVPRDLTVELAQRLDEGRHTSSEQSSWLLNGGSGNGKSQLMFQLVAHATQSDYVVMYIPKAHSHTSSRSMYHYNSKTQVFHQPYLSSHLLQRLIECKSNKPLLAKLPLAKSYTYVPDVPAGTGGKNMVPIKVETIGQKGKVNTVADLAAVGALNQDISVAILEDVLDILARQSTVPFFLAVDSAQAYFCETEYKTPEGHILQPYHLSVPRVLLEYISGRKQLTRGSIMLALSPSLTVPGISRSLLAGLGLANLPYSTTGGGDAPYSPRFYPASTTEPLKPWHVENARALQVVEVPEGMTVNEAQGLWGFGRRMRLINSDENFLSKYLESGGNPRELLRAMKYTMQ